MNAMEIRLYLCDYSVSNSDCIIRSKIMLLESANIKHICNTNLKVNILVILTDGVYN